MTRTLSTTGSVRDGRNHRPAQSSHLLRAFTLIELLVVIVVITVLAALLLPALAGAKRQAWRINCTSNEKELITAWTIYYVNDNDRLVLNGGDAATTSAQAHLWVQGGNHGTPDTLTNRQFLVGPNFALFAPILPGAQIYKCPADRTTWPLWSFSGSLKMVSELRSYAMNSYLGTTANGTILPLMLTAGYKVYQKSSQFAPEPPVNRFVFSDVNPANICTPGFGVDMSLGTWIHYPSGLHNRRGVMAFADGHTETHRWIDPRTLPQLTSGTYIGHGVAAAGNSDLAWIAQRTTSKK